MNSELQIIDLTPENISNYGVCGYKDIAKHKELRNKIAWFSEYYSRGLKIKALISKIGGYQGMIEYITGKFAHRPVDAENYMFIHCIFVGFKKEFKGKGYASALIDACIFDAKTNGMFGVVVVTRKGSFMVSNEIFLKKGFEIVESAKPDFDLLVLKFDTNSPNPAFKSEIIHNLEKYKKGLTIMRSVQCPYTEKNVNAIMETALKKYSIKTDLVDLNNHTLAQCNPSPFGTFSIIYNGQIISHHPISNTRFENIMNKLVVEK